MQLFKNYIFTLIILSASLISDNILAVNAAGVLPFSRDKQNRTYFYFGREGVGKAKGKFGDFGGGFKKTEKRFRNVASREFAEESMNIFKTRSGKTLNEKTTLEVINKHNIPSTYLKFRNGNSGYVTYFLRVQNDRNIYTTFRNKRNHLTKRSTRFVKNLFSKTEKNELVSVRKRDLCKAIKSNSPWVKVTQSTNKNNNGKKVKLRDCTFKSLRNAYNNGILQKL